MSELEDVGQELTELLVDKNINPQVAIESSIPDTDFFSKGKIVFTFIDYNVKQCGMRDLGKQEAKELMNKLKRISDIEIKDLASSRVIRDNVENAGKYSVLYDSLPEDIELKEIDYNDKGRIFGYLVDKYFCIVAIKVKHI